MKKSDWNTGKLFDCPSRVPLPHKQETPKQPVRITDKNTGELSDWPIPVKEVKKTDWDPEIVLNGEPYAIHPGEVRDIDTSKFNTGVVLYISENPGELTDDPEKALKVLK